MWWGDPRVRSSRPVWTRVWHLRQRPMRLSRSVCPPWDHQVRWWLWAMGWRQPGAAQTPCCRSEMALACRGVARRSDPADVEDVGVLADRGDEERCDLGPAQQVGEEAGSDRSEPFQDGRLEVEVEGLAGLLLGHGLQQVGVHGDVDVGSDAVVGRESVLQHGGADLIEGSHPSFRRLPVVVRVAWDGQVLQDRVQLGAGLDVEKSGDVPALIGTGQADVVLVHPLAPRFVEVVRVQDRTDLPHLGVELTRCDVLRDLQQRFLDQPGLGDPDMLERIRERDDVLERDQPTPGRPRPPRAGHGTWPPRGPSDGSGRRPGAAHVAPTW